MSSFNQVIIMGNLTRDPELRVLPKGTSICQFGMAVSRKFKDDSGQGREETTFIDLEAWGKTAELVAKYLKKGSAALVQGRLKLEQWDDKQSGQKRSKLKVVVEQVQFIGGRKDDAPRSDAPPSGSWGDEPSSPPARQVPPAVDDSIPF